MNYVFVVPGVEAGVSQKLGKSCTPSPAVLFLLPVGTFRYRAGGELVTVGLYGGFFST